jgi:nucleoside-diphosphate-sugar epimerase
MKEVLITGSTGMVGRSVLLECMESDKVDKITILNRGPIGFEHPKIKEILLNDFSQIETIRPDLDNFDACFHCMGVSALGMSKENYTHITYTLTKKLTDLMFELNPDMVFNYVSGIGTDSSEKGSSMWARVKGKTENYILNKGFGDAYMIRLGAILPEKGIKSKTGWYNALYVILRPIFPLLKKSSNFISTTAFGQAMINTMFFPQNKKYLENKDLNRLAEKQSDP